MASADADRNLLFGILALQMDFITRDALVAAMHAWVLEKAKPLGQVLVERGDLLPANRALLEPLVEAHVHQHGGDPHLSLAALSSVAPVREALAPIAEPDLQASLAALEPFASGENWMTVAPVPAGTSPTGSRFRILRPHARGGLGEVFVARDEELGRTVALKEIQFRHLDKPALRTRFLLEAEINGNLEHPGIVPVYGLGTYPDGRPFYAMRFVRGDSLKDAIERYHREAPGLSPTDRALRLRQLLGRFVDVCDAIAYAHSRGVLHRDLKPANVMLGKYGETLVVDWGLAKAVGGPDEPTIPEAGLLDGPFVPRSGDSTDSTVAGSALGTPGFMSPEQAAGRLELLDSRTDVYSLGATLYCLLTGKPPLTGDDVLARAMRGDFAPPKALNKHVPRALEAVCLKAMALNPGDRYPSAKALAEEVERWLADEAVLAEKEPWVDGLRRWTRRHRSLVLLASAGAVVLLVNLALLAWFQLKAAERERYQNRLLVVEQDKRRSEQARAEEKERASRTLTNFVVRLFQATDPLGLENRGFSTTEERMNMVAALRILESAIEQVDRPHEPGRSGDLVRATLIDTIGNALRATSDFRRARPLLVEALRIREGSLAADDPNVALSLFHLAMLDHFSGRLETADALYADAVGRLRGARGGDVGLLDRVEFHHAWALAEMKRLPEAGALIDRVLERRQKAFGKDNTDTKYAQLASYIIKLGSGDRAVLLREFGKLMLSRDPVAKAVFQYFQADSLRKKADQTRSKADVDQARQKLDEMLTVARASLPPRHFLLAYLLADMAEFERNHDNFERAVTLIREAFEIARQTAPTHPAFIDALGKYAEELTRRQQYDEAERALTEALDAIVARDDRERRAQQFQDYLGRMLRLPKYQENAVLADLLKKKYE